MTEPTTAAGPSTDADEPERTYTEDEYLEYGVVQYRRGSTQAKYEVEARQQDGSAPTERVNDDEHWHRGPSQSCPICRFAALPPSSPAA